MDLVAGDGALDHAVFGAGHLNTFYNTALTHGGEIFSAADHEFNESGVATTDQILLSLSNVYDVKSFRDSRKSALPSRARFTYTDAQNPGMWGEFTTINESAMQTFLKNQIIEIQLSDLSTTPVSLPDMKKHLNLNTYGEALVILRKGDNAGIPKPYTKAGKKTDIILTLQVQFLKDMAPVMANDGHVDKVKMAEHPAWRAITEVRSSYNNSHSTTVYKQNTMFAYFSHWTQNQMDIFDENFCGNKKATVHYHDGNGGGSAKDFVNSKIAKFQQVYGDSSLGSLAADKRKFDTTFNSVHEKIHDSLYSDPPAMKTKYETIVGNTCPKKKHDNVSLVVPWCNYISRKPNRTVASNTFGRTTCKLTLKFADKKDMFYLDSNGLQVVITVTLRAYDGERAFIPVYTHNYYVPVVAGSKIVGGDIKATGLWNQYVELDNKLNEMFLKTVTIDRTEVIKEAVQTGNVSSNSVSTNVSIHGLVTPSIITATQQDRLKCKQHECETWYKYGIVSVAPYVKRDHIVVPCPYLPKEIDDAYFDDNKLPTDEGGFLSTKTHDESKDGQLFIGSSLQKMNIVNDQVKGIVVMQDPVFESVSVIFGNSDFLSNTRTNIIDCFRLFSESPPNKDFTRYAQTIELSPGGSDPKIDAPGGPNLSRTPRSNIVGTLTEKAQKRNGNNQTPEVTTIVIHNALNYMESTQHAQGHLVV